MFFVELELVSFLNISSYYLIDNIVLVNKKSKNNHTKNTCMISTLHYYCPPHQHTATNSKLFSPPPPLNITITIIITIPTATILPLRLFTHPLTKALNNYTSRNIVCGIKKGISYQKTPKYLPTISQIKERSNYSLLYP